jgi:hypothetical protein
VPVDKRKDEFCNTERNKGKRGSAPTLVTPKSLKRNAKGETLLHRAAMKGNTKTVKALLLLPECDINAKDNAGWTPLHEACNHNHYEVAELLLQAGAKVNQAAYCNTTPLHDALSNGNHDVAFLLLQNKANPYKRDKNGLLPVDYVSNETVKGKIINFMSAHPPESFDLESLPCLIEPATSLCPRSVSPISSPLASENSQYNVAFTGGDAVERSVWEAAAKNLNMTVQSHVAGTTTHLLTPVNHEGCAKRTIKFLTGVLLGMWIVDTNWLFDSAKEKRIKDESGFEVRGDGTALGGPRKGRANKINDVL